MALALFGLAMLACPLGMGIVAWVMLRRVANPHAGSIPCGPKAEQLARVQAEIDQVRKASLLSTARPAEIDRGRSAGADAEFRVWFDRPTIAVCRPAQLGGSGHVATQPNRDVEGP